jgi:hypothetical protein
LKFTDDREVERDETDDAAQQDEQEAAKSIPRAAARLMERALAGHTGRAEQKSI